MVTAFEKETAVLSHPKIRKIATGLAFPSRLVTHPSQIKMLAHSVSEQNLGIIDCSDVLLC